ncbi:MAG: leucine-rich repeat protein [Prevotella sp.]|nr:leucine-rich repeat protein [Prevotella sp.]
MRKLLLFFVAFVTMAIGAKAQDMAATPLTLEAVEAGTITVKNQNALTLTYTSSVSGAQSSTANPVTIDVTAGETIALACNNTTKGMNFNITSTNDIYVYGNAMSLVFGSDFVGKTDLSVCTDYGILGWLFCLERDGQTLNPTIRNHPTKDIVLPATTLSSGCYFWMFSGCSNLTRGPQLPATTLAEDCYHRMFEYTGLVLAPELPAPTLFGQVYGGMFDHCANLRYVKCLATNLGENTGTYAALACWLNGVSATGTFIKADGVDSYTVGPQDKWGTVDGIPEGWTVKNASDFDPYATPLTLEAVEAGTINIYNPNTLTIEYSKDGATWTSDNSNPISIAVAIGDQVRFRGDNMAYDMFGDHGEQPTQFTATNDVYVYGNVMSLISSTGYPTLATLPKVGGDGEYDLDVNLAFLFCAPSENVAIMPKANTTIRNHPTKDIVLPAINVTRSGYMYMFASCEGLTRAPELPATDLGWGCYHQMFSNCTNLTTAPELLTPAPPHDAYSCMFWGCSNLNYVKCLATDISAANCTDGWLTGVAANGTFVKAAGMNDWTVGPQGEWNEVNGIPEGWTVEEEVIPTPYVAAETPLTLEAVEDGTTVSITNPLTLTIEYSTDGGTTWTSSNSYTEIRDIAAGGTVLLRGNNAAYSDGTVANSTIINCTKDCYIYGNMMSLVSADAFATATALTANYAFYDLFDSNAHLKNHDTKDLVLPATTLTDGCYSYMFYKCTALTKAPALPATTLATACYKSMFSGCSALEEPCTLPAMTLTTECYASMFRTCKALEYTPSLPATTLAEKCYSYMFYGASSLHQTSALMAPTLAERCYECMFGFCTSLVTSPAVKATTLAENCCYRMFIGCSSLTNISTLSATTMAPYCYNEMFRQCQALTKAPKLPATTLADYCYRCMFQACTALTTPPELPVTTMAQGCYLGMFVNTGLTAAPDLPATTLAKSCYYQMFQNNPKLASSPALPATELAEMCYYKMFADCPLLATAGDLEATTAAESSCEYMFSNCTGLVIAPALPATSLASACYNFMFQGCTALENAPVLPATTLATQCYQRMFDGCTSLVTAPALPATELAELCYNDMFWECTALTNAPDLPATTLADYCYTMMFLGCTSLKTAPVLPAATLTPGCYEHMFMNCNSLNYVKCLATDLGDETSTDGWLTNVAATGTFVKAEGADWSTKGTTEGTWGDPDSSEGTIPVTFVHGIPDGWTVQSDSSTGIEAMTHDQPGMADSVYDLTGRRIVNGKSVNRELHKGIYVKNGKKFIKSL